ncbi:MAG TPA: 1-deoxy-D-xylulose-5-phosphate reductoisomerase [Candidatus Limnocylindria bacterium]|jgi:1-deoxy-D-xylulose-5-phosphate reductoisomerase|nr:1-deoxy-D-xylulose-5-phosphate reductoisomerase [Candidatus Limnocylindria bacterium]
MTGPIRLAILGATGSIGRQALDVVRAHPDRLRVVALGANRNVDELRRLAVEFPTARTALGSNALAALATDPDAELVLVATPGVAALRATVAALQDGKRVALANKEVLVAAGHLIRKLSGGAGDRLRPVDSEHNGLWQCLAGEDLDQVRRVALTASGGAFRDVPLEALPGVTPQHALRHPTWKMGRKVTIDSATLVNKGYEVVEARWLYGLPYERIDVVYHPESLVHALVEYVDGSVKAQLAEPDMRLPIQYALLWGRAPSPVPRFDWAAGRTLHFGEIDQRRYPGFAAVLETARSGDLAAMVGLSAADEIAVESFLRGDIPFTDIAPLLRRGAELGARAGRGGEPELDEIIAIDAAVRAALSQQPAVA